MRLSLRHRLVIVVGFFMYFPVTFFTLLTLAQINIPIAYRFWEDRFWENDPIVGEIPSADANPFLVPDTSASGTPVPNRGGSWEVHQQTSPSPLPLWMRFCVAAFISWGIAAALIYPIAWVLDAIRPPERSSRPNS